jgi:hypothetical protein
MTASTLDIPGSLTPPRGLVFDAGLTLMVILFLTISAFALIEFGYQYGESGGTPLEKVHPATLVAGLLLLMSTVVRGNPLTAFLEAFARQPLVGAYLIGVALLMAHALFVAYLPFTVFIDTFIGPAILLLLLCDLDEDLRRRLALIVHALFALNSVIGIGEFTLGFRLTELHIEGELLEAEWRSSSLMGHPLSNAMLTGSYMVLLLSGGARDLPHWLKPIVFLIAAVSMVPFGGRAATALVMLFVAYHVARRFLAVVGGAPFDPRLVLAGLFGLPVLIGAIMLLADAGFFERFLGRLTDDDGSAGTRIAMFELFKHISWPELLFGPDRAQIETLMYHYGLHYGIESFWISTILAHGLIASFAFFFALGLFVVALWRRAPASLNALLYFFAVASASLSLSAKTVGFSILVLMILLLLPGARTGSPSRAGPEPAAGRPRLQVA